MWGINGVTGKLEDMSVADIWDPVSVKVQTYKTAIESAAMLLRIDDIVSGIKKEKSNAGGRKAQDSEEEENFGDERDG
jgi:T-complex protein 1 subunit gamma